MVMIAMALVRTRMEDNCQSRLFLYLGWLNATCFGLTGSCHEANKTQKKINM
jgi:hypothetical protein